MGWSCGAGRRHARLPARGIRAATPWPARTHRASWEAEAGDTAEDRAIGMVRRDGLPSSESKHETTGKSLRNIAFLHCTKLARAIRRSHVAMGFAGDLTNRPDGVQRRATMAPAKRREAALLSFTAGEAAIPALLPAGHCACAVRTNGCGACGSLVIATAHHAADHVRRKAASGEETHLFGPARRVGGHVAELARPHVAGARQFGTFQCRGVVV